LSAYPGYDPHTDPSISNVFSTAALRFGHSMVSPVMRRLNRNLSSIPEGDLSLHQAFFAPWRLVEEGGLDPLLRGLFASPAKLSTPGQTMNAELTERLFEVAHTVALDLAALNIQRGRDHGLASYTAWARHCGLLGQGGGWAGLRSLISDQGQLSRLESVYGSPDSVDVWVGGLMEDPVEGGRVGPTLVCLLTEQFGRLRTGDRFWYENEAVFTPAQRDQLRQANLGRLLCDNGDDIRKAPRDAFLTTSSLEELEDCSTLPRMSLRPWADCAVEEEVEVRRRREVRSSMRVKREANGAGALLRSVRESLSEDGDNKKIDKETEKELEEEEGEGERVCVDSRGKLRKEGEEWEVKVEEEEKEGKVEEEEKDKCVICRCHHYVICKLRKCKKAGSGAK